MVTPPPSHGHYALHTHSYEGCYNDTLSDFEMANVPVIDFQYTTQESCDLHCEDAGYGYFALEFGFLCQCGDVLPNPSREIGDEWCDLVSCFPSFPASRASPLYFEVYIVVVAIFLWCLP